MTMCALSNHSRLAVFVWKSEEDQSEGVWCLRRVKVESIAMYLVCRCLLRLYSRLCVLFTMHGPLLVTQPWLFPTERAQSS